MEKLQSSLSNMVLVLTGFAVIIGALLAWVNHLTEAPIRAKAEQTLQQGIKTVMGTQQLSVSATDTLRHSIDGKQAMFIVHSAVDGQGKPLGAAVETTTMGFGGDLRVLVGFNPQGVILGYTILQSAETPGLGQKADKWFQKGGRGSIIGMSPAKGDLAVTKDGGQVDAITASTITSRAFLKAINQAYAAFVHKDVDEKSGAGQQMKKG